jgi:hypothetical protein
MEMVVNERVSGEKVLRLLGRFEPLHLPFLGVVSVDGSFRLCY